MTIKRTWTFFLSLFLFVYSLRGQDYIFKRYTASNGLINNVILRMMEDSYGFLWLSTASGVSRFDGRNFTNYGYTEGLENLIVNCMFEDKSHRLWIGTAKGIAELRGSRFKMYTNDETSESVIFNIYEFSEYGLVAFTGSGTFRLDNDDRWKKINLPGKPVNMMNYDGVESKDGIYLDYDHALVFKKRGGGIQVVMENTSRDQSFCNGFATRDGRLYVGIYNRIFELSDGKATLVIDSIPIDDFFNFIVDTSQTFWINIGKKGLYKYAAGNENKKSIYRFDSNTAGFPFLDRQGNLWITSFEGLVKVTPKVFEDHSPLDILRTGKRMNIIPGVADDVILSDAFGLHVLKKGKTERIKRPACYKDEDSYCQDIVEGSSKDNRGFTWMMTRQRKVFCWTGTRLEDYSYQLSPGPDYIRNVSVNRADNSLFICDDTTLVYGGERKFTPFVDSKGNIFSGTTTILFTRDGVGLVNVYDKGVYFITRDREILKAPPGLDIVDKGSFTYFFEDRQGWIWISNAGKGLVRFRIGQDYSVRDLSVLTTEQGLPSNKIASMAFDSEGGIWVSCSNGLVVLKENAAIKNEWEVYSIGIHQEIFMEPPIEVVTDNSTNVWLASLDKVLKVDASKLVLKKLVPRVMLERVLLDMKETNWSSYSNVVRGYRELPESPDLNYFQNNLGIEFSAVSPYNAEYFEYSYLLEPLEEAWSVPTVSKNISLVNLSPGEYSFKVRARGKGTAWSEPDIFNFSIRSPFWDTWWFRSLVALVAATVIIAVYRNRVKKIKDEAELQNQVRELEMKALKAQMNPHFIYNALNSVQSLIADNRKSEAIDYIGKFSRLLRQVLDYSDTNLITLGKELDALKLYIQLESLRLNMDLDYSIKISDDLISESIKVPPLILQPFVENALWHGLSRQNGPKKLKITVSQEYNSILCVVEDNGIGRVSAAAYKRELTTEFYSSKGIDITIKRLTEFNRSTVMPVKYADLYGEAGNAIGTRVDVSIRRFQ